MKLCTRCNAQFGDEHDHCLHCGGPLGDESLPAESAGVDGGVLLSIRQPIFAIPVLNALAEAQIDFELIADGGTRAVNWLHGSSGQNASIEVYVAPDHLDAAQRIEAAVLARELPDLPEGYDTEHRTEGACPACGHVASGDLPECPDCGLHFPADEA